MSSTSLWMGILLWSPVSCSLASPHQVGRSKALFFQHKIAKRQGNHKQSRRGVRLAAQQATTAPGRPIEDSKWPWGFPAKEHCSKCGLCETSLVSQVMTSCAFLGDGMARMDPAEQMVHGRRRRLDDMVWSARDTAASTTADEGRFGVLHQPIHLARGVGLETRQAQWTGCVTSIALAMLETGAVDAVVCIASRQQEGNEGGEGWSEPEPIVARTPEDVLRGRGVKPALAPSLKVLDQIHQDPSIRNLLFCGVGCAVQAFRAVQHTLNLDNVFVLGTNCADNSPTPQAAREFLREGVQVAPDEEANVRGYEFMQDFRVHVKLAKNEQDPGYTYLKKPYFCLPGTIADAAIAKSCLACFDYTNALADVVVGYMGAPLHGGATMDQSYQMLTVRNERGASMVQTALEANRLDMGPVATGNGKHEKMAMATVSSDSIVLAMTHQEVPTKGVPRILAEVMATVLTRMGPKGIHFARYSIDYHVLRNYLHVLEEWGEARAESFLPAYAREIVQGYLQEEQSFAQLKHKVTGQKDGK